MGRVIDNQRRSVPQLTGATSDVEESYLRHLVGSFAADIVARWKNCRVESMLDLENAASYVAFDTARTRLGANAPKPPFFLGEGRDWSGDLFLD